MGKDAEAAAEGLEDALAEESESSTDENEREVEAKETATEEGRKSPKGEKKPGPIPYDRFQEVNSRMRELEEAVGERDAELQKRTEALDSMARVLEEKERDAGYVQQLRELYHSGDEKWKPVLEDLEKKLAGIEDDVESGDKTKKEGADETRKALKKVQSELEDQVLDQRADLIIQKADVLAETLLDQLPEEYSDQDKQRIAFLWTDAVNWEAVEEAEDWQGALGEELRTSLEYILNDIYGEPEGLLARTWQEKFAEESEKQPKGPSPEERVQELMDKDWGKFEVKEGKKGKTFNPSASDEEFSRAMAQAMKAANEAGKKAS